MIFFRIWDAMGLHKFVDQKDHGKEAVGLGDDHDPLWVMSGDADDLFFEGSISLRVHVPF